MAAEKRLLPSASARLLIQILSDTASKVSSSARAAVQSRRRPASGPQHVVSHSRRPPRAEDSSASAHRSCRVPLSRSCSKNSATRLLATADRYLPWTECHRSAGSRRPPSAAFARRVPAQLVFLGGGVPLPSVESESARHSERNADIFYSPPSIVPPRSRPKAAMHTFEMAWALRAPTFRVYANVQQSCAADRSIAPAHRPANCMVFVASVKVK